MKLKPPDVDRRETFQDGFIYYPSPFIWWAPFSPSPPLICPLVKIKISRGLGESIGSGYAPLRRADFNYLELLARNLSTLAPQQDGAGSPMNFLNECLINKILRCILKKKKTQNQFP